MVHTKERRRRISLWEKAGKGRQVKTTKVIRSRDKTFDVFPPPFSSHLLLPFSRHFFKNPQIFSTLLSSSLVVGDEGS